MDWQWIDNNASLREVVTLARREYAVAMDTEFLRERTFYPQLALLQLCIGGNTFLLDPLRISDPSPLRDLFEDVDTIKVFHSCAEDLEVLNNWIGTLPEPIFDTQIAASLLGMGFMLSYSKLVSELCSVELYKTETRSNWLQRPLTNAQVKYATQDVYYLDIIWRNLIEKSDLDSKTDWILSDGQALIEDLNKVYEYDHLRISGGRKLSRLQLCGLYALSRWRELQAKERDLPRRWIIDDKACLRLLEMFPCSRNSLGNIKGLPADIKKKFGGEITDLFKQCLAKTERELPPLKPDPLSKEKRGQVKSLKSFVQEIALELGTVPEILIRSRDYPLLLDICNGKRERFPNYWNGWRDRLVIQRLKERSSHFVEE